MLGWYGYYMRLSWRDFLRSPWMSIVMLIVIGLGIGASFTMLTLTRVMTQNPLPESGIYTMELDARPRISTQASKPDQLTWTDANNLLSGARAKHQAAMVGGNVAIIPSAGLGSAFYARARFTSSDFFSMFAVPFTVGSGWTRKEDNARARVAVISSGLANRLFGGKALGKSVTVGSEQLQVIGVMGIWAPPLHFYDLGAEPYGKTEDIFIPLSTAMDLNLPTSGKITCWDHGDISDLKSASCAWLQYWFQLDGSGSVQTYQQYLTAYVDQQIELGRLERKEATIYSLGDWIEKHELVPSTVKLETFLALGFLLICLINAAALLFIIFLRKGGELAVRRAMGASSKSIFNQLLCQASLVGIGGGFIGAALTELGMKFVHSQVTDYADVATVHYPDLIAATLFALVATLAAAAYPAWRSCKEAPGHALKLQ